MSKQGMVVVGQQQLPVHYTLTGDEGVLTGNPVVMLDLTLYSGQEAVLHLADGSVMPINLFGGQATATTYGQSGQVKFRRRSV